VHASAARNPKTAGIGMARGPQERAGCVHPVCRVPLAGQKRGKHR
jgi:hypothetical protein